MKIRNQRDLAEYLEVTQPTIRYWMEQGLPYNQVGLMRYEFDLEKVLRWLVKKSPRHAEWVKGLCEKTTFDK